MPPLNLKFLRRVCVLFALLHSSLLLAAPAQLPEPTTLPEPPTSTQQPPAWIQWLGFSPDGQRLAWRHGPSWAPMLPGSPIEIVRLDPMGNIVDHVHQRLNPRGALTARKIHSPEPVRMQRITDRDVLVQTTKGRLFAVVVRQGKQVEAAVLEKRRGSYDPLLRWNLRGPANRVEVLAFEDWTHRLLALVVHTDQNDARQAQLVVLPMRVPGAALLLPNPASPTQL